MKLKLEACGSARREGRNANLPLLAHREDVERRLSQYLPIARLQRRAGAWGQRSFGGIVKAVVRSHLVDALDLHAGLGLTGLRLFRRAREGLQNGVVLRLHVTRGVSRVGFMWALQRYGAPPGAFSQSS